MVHPSKIPVYGNPVDFGAVTQITCAASHERCVAAALMADHHLGYAVPIGGVLAYEDAISPSGVGFDIACGNKAIKLDADPEVVKRDISKIMDEIVGRISFGIGRNNANTTIDHPIFDKDHPGWEHESCKQLKRFAQGQLGTVGAGNHYVDVFISDANEVWVGCHFGSRGLGHKIATWFLKAGGAKDGINAEPLVFTGDNALFAEYVACMRLAGEYAYAGRDWVCDEVARIIGANITDSVHNHHNYAWQEGEYIVVRKGATPAKPGQRGFIGSSMGENSVIIHGVTPEEQTFESLKQMDETLLSTVHGAGRAMSRTAARGKTNRKTGEIISPGW